MNINSMFSELKTVQRAHTGASSLIKTALQNATAKKADFLAIATQKYAENNPDVMKELSGQAETLILSAEQLHVQSCFYSIEQDKDKRNNWALKKINTHYFEFALVKLN